MTDDIGNKDQNKPPNPFSRREFIAATGAGLAAATTSSAAAGASDSNLVAASGIAAAKNAPYDSLRDYVQMLEARGLLLRFDRIDQDAYEGTALMYRLVDRYGWTRTPVVLFEEVKIDGRWMQGPVLANISRHVDIEALMFGVEPVPGDTTAT
jgi:hypothetical protein